MSHNARDKKKINQQVKPQNRLLPPNLKHCKKLMYEKSIMLALMQAYIKKPHYKYPCVEDMLLSYGWSKGSFYRILGAEVPSENEIENLNYWMDKLRELQKHYLINKIDRYDSMQGAMFLLDRFHPKEEETTHTGMSRVDYISNLLWHDIQLFFTLANKPCLDITKKFIHWEGGRSGGKSEQIAMYSLYLGLRRTEGGTFLCGREVKISLDTSVKPLLERVINRYGAEDLFEIQRDRIIVKHNKVKYVFMGLKDGTSQNRDTVKSTDLLFGVWVEEAQTVSELSLDKLIPTAARVKDFQVVFTYNRDRVNTVVYDYFFGEQYKDGCKYPEWTQHINSSYLDNKYNTQELIDLAELDKQANYRKWLFIWGGEPQTDFEGGLWTYDLIKELKLDTQFDRNLYKRLIIAVDPATSSKEYNNEYGIVVMGITENDIVHLIDDKSGIYTAGEFARIVNQAYLLYEAEAIVYESNAGGEHIAQTILSENKSVRIIPVWASQNKYLRALPIANISMQGLLRFIKNFPVIENQMLLMTTNGYMGADGESPDRLDAMVWGCYELLKINTMNTQDIYFKKEYFKIIDFAYSPMRKVIFLNVTGTKTVIITCESFIEQKGIDNIPRILITDITTLDTNEIPNQDFQGYEIIACDNNIFDFDCEHIPNDMPNIVKLASLTINKIQDNFLYIANSTDIETLITVNVCSFQPEIKNNNYILESILKLVYNEFKEEIINALPK